MPDDYTNSNGVYYIVDIEDFDSNIALAQLLKHPVFWSNERYCRMKCRQKSLLIKPFRAIPHKPLKIRKKNGII